MARLARITPAAIKRAMDGTGLSDVPVAVIMQPDGSVAIVPADRISLTVTANDLDERLAKFGAK